MKRRNFLRDIALGIAATLVPRILMPVIPEVGGEFEFGYRYIYYDDGCSHVVCYSNDGITEIPEWAKYYSVYRTDYSYEFFEIKPNKL